MTSSALLLQTQKDYRTVLATRACFVSVLGALVAVGITRQLSIEVPFQILACAAAIVAALFGGVRSALEELDLPRRPEPIPIEFLKLTPRAGEDTPARGRGASIRTVSES